MLYIPFSQNTIQTPTFVSNLTYTGSLVPVQAGDFVNVRTNNVNVLARSVNSFSSGFGGSVNFVSNWTMMGSLLFANMTSGFNPTASNNFFTPPSIGASVTVNANTSTILFQGNNINQVPEFAARNMMLLDFRIPNIFLNDSLPAPTNENPYMITFLLSVIDTQNGNQMVYENRITIGIVSSSANVVVLPFDMPLPGNSLSREDARSNGRWYYIESLVPSFNVNYFVQNSQDLYTFSYPRIPTNNGFAYQCNIVNGARPCFIKNDVNNNLGSNILSQFNFRQV